MSDSLAFHKVYSISAVEFEGFVLQQVTAECILASSLWPFNGLQMSELFGCELTILVASLFFPSQWKSNKSVKGSNLIQSAPQFQDLACEPATINISED